MPHINPYNHKVTWPVDEGTLGVVGVAPWATIEFCKAFYSLIKAKKDWHYPRVIIDINTKIPSRGRHLQLGERDPSPYITESIIELGQQGATVVVVPCNTAHILYDRWIEGTNIQVPNIISETIRMAKAVDSKKASALVSKSLDEFDIYGKWAEYHNFELSPIDLSSKNIVLELIELIKLNDTLDGNRIKMFDIICRNLKNDGIDTLLLGCTELTILKTHFERKGFTIIDSNYALAHAALSQITTSLPD